MLLFFHNICSPKWTSIRNVYVDKWHVVKNCRAFFWRLVDLIKTFLVTINPRKLFAQKRCTDFFFLRRTTIIHQPSHAHLSSVNGKASSNPFKFNSGRKIISKQQTGESGLNTLNDSPALWLDHRKMKRNCTRLCARFGNIWIWHSPRS